MLIYMIRSRVPSQGSLAASAIMRSLSRFYAARKTARAMRCGSARSGLRLAGAGGELVQHGAGGAHGLFRVGGAGRERLLRVPQGEAGAVIDERHLEIHLRFAALVGQ